MGANAKDITGVRFGRLTAIKKIQNSGLSVMWECICDCGNIHNTRGTSLRSGWTNSCGCYQSDMTIETRTKHNKCKSSEYITWVSLKQRCLNEKCIRYHQYGGRGITVCDRWKNSFVNFYSDMGQKPTSKHSIDRIDVNGNYEPSNCRWATNKEQCSNLRRNIWVEYNGNKNILSEWARIFKISHNKLYPEFKKYGVLAFDKYANKN